MKNGKLEAIILYSGGLDSSAVAAVYGKAGYNTVHLLTFDNGTQMNVELSAVKVPEIQRRFPDTEFRHSILPTKYLFKQIALKTLEQDFKKYSTNLICVGCKMAMHTEAAVYALKHGIDEVADGFVQRQEEFPEQDITFVREMLNFHKSYGITYKSPLYTKIQSKEDVKSMLFLNDLSTKSIEPNCMMGGTFSPAKKNEIKAYFVEKKPLLDEYIRQQLSERRGRVEQGLTQEHLQLVM